MKKEIIRYENGMPVYLVDGKEEKEKTIEERLTALENK